MSKFIGVLSLLAATTIRANDGIPENFFTDNNGIEAAKAAAP